MKIPPPAELEHLLNALADDTIDEAGEHALAAWLKRDTEARRHYRDFMGLHAGLHWDYVQSAMPAREAVVQRPARFWWRWPLAAAAMLAALFGVVKLLSPHGGEPPVASVALLARAVAADWEDGARQPGRALAPGWLRLKSGAVQIEFSRGAHVVLEGPTEFQLVSDNEGFLRRGKLRASVPVAAHGFTIRGEGFSVVDRGTEFGVIAGERAEVHVFAGRVELARAKGTEPARVLAAGRALRIGEGGWRDLLADASAFVGPDDLNRTERREAWRRAAAALDAHPAALVHYDFEQTRKLTNRVNGRDISASIIGSEAAEGRWSGQRALAFKTAEDRVRFTVPGEMPSLTLLAWVRVDSLPNVQSSLMMSQSEWPGDVHWYLHRTVGLGLAIIAPDGRWRRLATGMPLRREQFGTWLFLAATFDGTTGTATLFINGRAAASQSFGETGPLRPGTVELGNWGLKEGTPVRASKNVVKEPAGYIRNFVGRMDEFAILSAPLSAEEIHAFYEAGRATADTSPPISK